jgi:uncharacterized membrane protein
MEVEQMKALDIAMWAICAALYAVIGRLTDLGLTFVGVAFWPAAVIPAVFAVLFGPWVAGFGAGTGIFIRDMLFHGDPWLSLTAGVSANFVGFFIIGYISRSNLDWKKTITSVFMGSAIIVAGLLLPTILLPAESEAYFLPQLQLSTLEIVLLFVGTVVASLLIITAVSRFWPQWRSFGVGSVIGLGMGALIVAVGVWGYSQFFYSPQGYFKAAIPSTFMPLIFVWTFATEIPFILLLGPPIIEACTRAFPSLRTQQKAPPRKEQM